MEKILEWVSSKFQNPLSFFFFLLGAVLILLGISTGINIPVLQNLVPDPNHRSISLIIGIVSCSLAVLIYYRPPKGGLIHKGTPIPEELKANFITRRVSLSEQQGRILVFVEKVCYPTYYASQDQIEAQFNQYSQGELFYRLEHLRLLGFIERQKIGNNSDDSDRYAYLLSAAYKKEIENLGPYRYSSYGSRR